MEDKNDEIFVDTPKFGKEGNFVICFGSSGKSTMIKVSWENKWKKNWKLNLFQNHKSQITIFFSEFVVGK